jgi:hypothetical protein
MLGPPRHQPPLAMLGRKGMLLCPCPFSSGYFCARPKRRPNIEHLAGVELSSRLWADRPSPGTTFRPRALLAFLCKPAQPLILFLSSRSWPRSPPNVTGQQTPRLGKAPAASQYISMLALSLTQSPSLTLAYSPSQNQTRPSPPCSPLSSLPPF